MFGCIRPWLSSVQTRRDGYGLGVRTDVMVLGQIQVPELDGPPQKGPKTLEAKRAVRWVRAPAEQQLEEWQIEKRSLQKTIRSQAVRLSEMKRELDVQSVKLSRATESMAQGQDWLATSPSTADRSTPRVDLEAELQRAFDEQTGALHDTQSQLRDAQRQLAAVTGALAARAQEQLDRTLERGVFENETATLRTFIAKLEDELSASASRLAAATEALDAHAQEQRDRAVERGVFESEAATLRNRIAQLEGELSASTARLTAVTAALDARAQELRDRAVERGGFESEFTALRTRIAQLEGELSASNSQVDKLTSSRTGAASALRVRARLLRSVCGSRANTRAPAPACHPASPVRLRWKCDALRRRGLRGAHLRGRARAEHGLISLRALNQQLPQRDHRVPAGASCMMFARHRARWRCRREPEP